MDRIKVDLTRPEGWRDQASNLADWERWDAAWRRKLGWRPGLSVWRKTNTPGSRVLLSRHWPHRLCWSWSIWVGKRRESFDGPPKFIFVASRRYRMVSIWLGAVYAQVTWQDSDWMPGLQYKHDAPTIYWKHHLEHAEPAGTA